MRQRQSSELENLKSLELHQCTYCCNTYSKATTDQEQNFKTALLINARLKCN